VKIEEPAAITVAWPKVRLSRVMSPVTSMVPMARPAQMKVSKMEPLVRMMRPRLNPAVMVGPCALLLAATLGGSWLRWAS
jgi:hypothetical protein